MRCSTAWRACCSATSTRGAPRGRPRLARTVSTHQGNPVARKAPPIGERHPPPGAIEQAAPLKTDDETARGWLREALSLNDDLSDTDRRTIEAAVALLDLD